MENAFFFSLNRPTSASMKLANSSPPVPSQEDSGEAAAV